MLAAALVIAFQIGIMLTGSYNWFNLLTVLLCLFLLRRSGAAHACCRAGLPRASISAAPRPGRLATALATLVALIVVPVGLNLVYAPLAGRNLPVAGAMTEALAPLLIVNPYGLFATTTTTRPVIVIEGSDDNSAWREYALPLSSRSGRRARRRGASPTSRASTGSFGLPPMAAPARTAGSSACCSGCSKAARACGAVRGEPVRRPARRSTCARCSTTIVSRMRDRGGRSAAGRWWVRRLDGTYYPSTSLADFHRAAAPAGRRGLPLHSNERNASTTRADAIA